MSSQQNVFIYIHEWEFKSQADQELFEQQPTPGRVYAASIDPLDQTIKITIPKGAHRVKGIQGIMVHNFQGDNDRWRYYFEEVNEKNISSLGIKDEDFQLIMSGIPERDDKLGIFDSSTDAQDPEMKESKPAKISVKVIKTSEKVPQNLLEELARKLFEEHSQADIDDLRDRAISAMVKIENIDEEMLSTITDVLEFIASSYEEDGDAEIYTGAMALVGMNSAEATTTLMFNALTLLSRYTQSVKRGESPDIELLKSVVFLIGIEILQRKRNTENGN